jgi:hypothetical protein
MGRSQEGRLQDGEKTKPLHDALMGEADKKASWMTTVSACSSSQRAHAVAISIARKASPLRLAQLAAERRLGGVVVLTSLAPGRTQEPGARCPYVKRQK